MKSSLVKFILASTLPCTLLGCGEMRPVEVTEQVATLNFNTATAVPGTLTTPPILSTQKRVTPTKKPLPQKKQPIQNTKAKTKVNPTNKKALKLSIKKEKPPKSATKKVKKLYEVDPRSWSICKEIVNNPKYKVPWGDNYVIYAEVNKDHTLKRDKNGKLVGFGARNLPRKCHYQSKRKTKMSRAACFQQSKYNFWSKGFCQKCLKVKTKYRWMKSWSKMFFHELQKLENRFSSNHQGPKSLISISQELLKKNTDSHYQTDKGQTVEHFKFRDDIKNFCPQISNDQTVYKHALFWQSLFKYMSFQESSHHPHAILCRRSPDKTGKLTNIWYPNVGLLQLSPHLLKRAKRINSTLTVYPENASHSIKSIYHKYGCSGADTDTVEGLLKIKNNLRCGIAFAAALINNDKQIYGKLQPSVKTFRSKFRSYIPFYGGLPRYWQPMRASDRTYFRETYKDENGKQKLRLTKITKQAWIKKHTRNACSIYFNPKKTNPYAQSIVSSAQDILGVGHHVSPSKWTWVDNVIHRNIPIPEGKSASLRQQEVEDIMNEEAHAREWQTIPHEKLRMIASMPEDEIEKQTPKLKKRLQQEQDNSQPQLEPQIDFTTEPLSEDLPSTSSIMLETPPTAENAATEAEIEDIEVVEPTQSESQSASPNSPIGRFE